MNDHACVNHPRTAATHRVAKPGFPLPGADRYVYMCSQCAARLGKHGLEPEKIR